MKKHDLKASSEQGSGLNIARYLTLLHNNIKFICIVVIITSLTGFIVSYLLPKKYEATSTISIEENIVSDLVEGIAITTSAESKIRLLELQLLSRNLITEVASILDMDLLADTEEKKEELFQSLRASTYISHNKKRGFFSVTFLHKDAVLARDFVNTLIRVYVETNTSEKRQESFDATTFLSEQIKIFQSRIEKAQQDIDAFKTEQSMFLTLSESVVQQKIISLDQQLESITIEKNKLLSQQHMQSDSSILADELHKKEAELYSAQSIYTKRHPIVQRLTLDIQGIKKRLEDLEKNPPSQSSNTQFKATQIELKALEEKEQSITSERDKNIKNLELLPNIRTKLSDLEQRKANEMLIYQKLVSRFGQSEVSKQMELQDKAVSFKVIDAAVTPTSFVFPKRYLFMIGAIIAGFGLAVGLIIARSILRTRIYSAHDLNIYTVPVLAKLPVIIRPELLRKRERHNIVAMLITACVIALICIAAGMELLGLTYIEAIFPV